MKKGHLGRCVECSGAGGVVTVRHCGWSGGAWIACIKQFLEWVRLPLREYLRLQGVASCVTKVLEKGVADRVR